MVYNQVWSSLGTKDPVKMSTQSVCQMHAVRALQNL
jgi:hypothetical protein